MAEFCLECVREMVDKNATARSYIVSKEPWLCEGCGQIKPVVIERRSFHSYIIMMPFWILIDLTFIVLNLLWLIIKIPFFIYKIITHRKKN